MSWSVLPFRRLIASLGSVTDALYSKLGIVLTLTILSLDRRPRLGHTKEWCSNSRWLYLFWGVYVGWMAVWVLSPVAQSRAENMRLSTDTLLKSPCLRVEGWKCGSCPIFALYTLAFTLQLRKNHGKSSVSIQLLRTKCKIFYLKIQFVPRSKHFISFIKPDQFMLYRT